MANDLEIIKQLEKEIGGKLRIVGLEKISGYSFSGVYAVDEENRVIGLNLGGKKLSKIPQTVLKLSHLIVLNLWNNKIVNISPIKELQDLTQLYLSYNQISDISVLKDLSNLTQLNLWNNQISDISVLKDLSNLTQLYLSLNQISDISVFKDLSNLTRLVLWGNQISDISVLKDLSNLTILDLSANQISDISVLKDLSNLTQLHLNDNQISDISVLKDLSNLTGLYLSRNQISDISVLKDLSNLTQLHLNDNQISDISVLKDLSNLMRLDLKENKIRELPAEIVDLKMDWKWGDLVSGLSLKGNPLETPPVEIVKKGKEAVRAYFKSLEGEKQALNEVKVLLVGDGGAGKTSLVKQLFGETFNKKESKTDGIDIRDGKIKTTEKNILVHFWDFGGQEIMHATHQFFLSKRSLYILVLDGRKEEDAEYWLKHIESFGGTSPVLVAINKIDQHPGFDVNRKFLLEKYPSIKGFIRISCKNGEGIKNFYGQLNKQLTIIEHLKTLWAKSWFNVKKQLEKMEGDYISYEQYEKICNKENITGDESQTTLVDFLNDLGIILHFKEPALKETNVINPRWVTEAVYKIINSKELADNKGVLKKKTLKEILDDKKYPERKHDYIIELMKKFELRFSVDENTVLIPDLLKVDEPGFGFDYDTSLKFLLEYDFLPKSVIARFIVKRHKDIKEELRWRTGVVLEDKDFNSSAVVKVDERDKKIYIYVNGEQKRDCFSVVRKTFKEINDSFEKMEVKEMVPLPDQNEISVKYTALTGLEQMGIREYVSGELKKSYDIKQLLNGIVSEAERKQEYMKLPKPNGDMYLKIEQNVKQLNIQKQEMNVDIDINIKVDLPAAQEYFDELKDILLEKKPELKRKLGEIGDSLDEVHAGSKKEELTKPMTKLGRFLKKLGEKNSDLYKLISGTKKGIEYAQKLGTTYNKFAQWLALPQIPDLFL